MSTADLIREALASAEADAMLVATLRGEIASLGAERDDLARRLAACEPPVPLVAGMLSRKDPSGPDGWNPEVKVSSLWPVAGAPMVRPNAIDAAIERGLPFRLRLRWGIDMPDWARAATGSVLLTHPDFGQRLVWCWWRARALEIHGAMQAELADEYDGIPLVWFAGAMTFYAETCLRGLGGDAGAMNQMALRDAGYTTEADLAAQEAMIAQHAVWKRTRTGMAFNPYQRLTATGMRNDLADTARLMDALGGLEGAVIQNNSLRQSHLSGTGDYQDLYAEMWRRHDLDAAPVSFQTATWDKIHPRREEAVAGERVAALLAACKWVIDRGGHAVETPSGHVLTVGEVAALSSMLKDNVS